jgi:hypothetical protein
MLILIISRFDIHGQLLSELLMDALFTGHQVFPLLVLYFLIMALNKEPSWHLEILLSTISCLCFLRGLQFLIGLRQSWLGSGRIGILLSLSLLSLRLLALFLLFTALLFFTGLISLLHILGGGAGLQSLI